MADDIQGAIEKDDFEWLKTISLIKYECDRFADYCRRAINSRLKSDYKRLAPLYVIVEQMEKVSDNYKELCEHISSNKIKLNKESKKLFHKLVEFNRAFYELFFKFELGRMNNFQRLKEKLQLDINIRVKSANRNELQLIIIFDRILNIILGLNGPLMAVYI